MAPTPRLRAGSAFWATSIRAVLERIVELRHIAQHGCDGLLRQIASVAREFEAWISPDEFGRSKSPNIVLPAMLANADDATRPIVEALASVLHTTRHARVA